MILLAIDFEGQLCNSFLTIVVPVVAFVGGLLAGLYIDDYKEDRDWCSEVDQVTSDTVRALSTIINEGEHDPEGLADQVKRIED